MRNKLKDIIKSSQKAFADGKKHVKRPFNYFGTFIKDPGVAAIHPSSSFLVGRVLRAMDMKKTRRIIEFGAAEGVMTRKMLKHLKPEGFLFAIEKNKHFFNSLDGINDPRFKAVCADIKDFRQIMNDYGIGNVDCIVSGVPFSFFSPEERQNLIADVYSALSVNGRFVAYQCTTHLIPIIKKRFPKTHIELEIRNIPPHFVLTGIK